VSHAEARNYQPTNITFGIMPALDKPPFDSAQGKPRSKMERKLAISERALKDLDEWMSAALKGCAAK
jgi:folate-dependent tRNA-U54 methylase TrmFO/GidA